MFGMKKVLGTKKLWQKSNNASRPLRRQGKTGKTWHKSSLENIVSFDKLLCCATQKMLKISTNLAPGVYLWETETN